MTHHFGLPVSGYRAQSEATVATVNLNKEMEERLLRQIEALEADPINDARMLALGFTKVQEAFMWINRAVFQPARVELPEDRAPGD